MACKQATNELTQNFQTTRNSDHYNNPGPCTQSTDSKSTNATSKATLSCLQNFLSEKERNNQEAEKKDVLTWGNNSCLTTINSTTTRNSQARIAKNSFQNVFQTSVSSLARENLSTFLPKNASNYDNASTSMPVVNIYHNIGSSEKSATSEPRVIVEKVTSQGMSEPEMTQQGTQFLASHSFLSQYNLSAVGERSPPSDLNGQTTFPPLHRPVSSDSLLEANLASASTEATDDPNVQRDTQHKTAIAPTVSSTNTKTTSKADKTSTEISSPVNSSIFSHTVSKTFTDSLVSVASSNIQSPTSTTVPTSTSTPTPTPTFTPMSTPTPTICLSKLLGQPSVAYLPAGHFINNRNAIVGAGGGQASGVEKLPPFTSSVLGGKMSSAAAKLHLLSTQAGNKIGDFPQDLGKGGGACVDSKFQSLAVPVSSGQGRKMKTMMTLSSKSGGRKTITFSKVVPVSKFDTLSELKQTKIERSSQDKQVQAGQRYVPKSKISAGKNQQTCQIFPQNKQSTSQSCNQGEQKRPENKVSDQNIGPQAMTQKPGCKDIFMDELNTVTSVMNKENQQKVKVGQKMKTQKNPNIDINQRNAPLTSATAVSNKHDINQGKIVPASVLTSKPLQPRGKVMNIKSATKRQMTEITEMSVEDPPSLSAFPYIQQMTLPDGQVSTIAHNSHYCTEDNDSVDIIATTQESSTMISCSKMTDTSSKPSSSMAGFLNVETITSKPTSSMINCPNRKEISPKPTVRVNCPKMLETSSKATKQATLSKSQQKLSVSIQTSMVHSNKTSGKNPKQMMDHPVKESHLNTSPLQTDKACRKSEDSVNEYVLPNKPSVEETVTTSSNQSANIHCTKINPVPRKRKRVSPSRRRNAKTCKMHI